MLDIGWSELLVIGVVALIVVGPKDLPVMFRTLGRFTGKMQSMARDFRRAMDDAARQSGMDDVARDLKTMTSSKSLGLNALEQAASKFEKWDPVKNAAKPSAPAAKAADTTAAAGPAPEAKAPDSASPAASAMGAETAALAARKGADRSARIEAARSARKPRTEAPVALHDAPLPAAKRQTRPKAVATPEGTASEPKPRARRNATAPKDDEPAGSTARKPRKAKDA